MGLGSGAQFMSSGNITAPGYSTPYACLGLYNTAYTSQNTAGKATLTYTDSTFGSGTQELYRQGGSSYGAGSKTASTAGGYWASLPTGGTQVATAVFSSTARTVIGRCTYGSGHVAVCSFDPELRGDSLLDWSEWDNWAMSNTQTNSVGGWSLLGRMVNYAATGTATAPTITTYANPTGKNVAIYSTYTYYYGGAYSGNLPGIFRAVANAGDVPLAIRANDVGTNLTTTNFKTLILGGGYTLGYKESLGYSKTTGDSSKIATFANGGGGVMGICAGAYYLCNTINYDGTNNIAELGLYAGSGNGELSDIATYPNGALTPIATNDTYIGNLGTLQIFYEGGPYFPRRFLRAPLRCRPTPTPVRMLETPLLFVSSTAAAMFFWSVRTPRCATGATTTG